MPIKTDTPDPDAKSRVHKRNRFATYLINHAPSLTASSLFVVVTVIAAVMNWSYLTIVIPSLEYRSNMYKSQMEVSDARNQELVKRLPKTFQWLQQAVLTKGGATNAYSGYALVSLKDIYIKSEDNTKPSKAYFDVFLGANSVAKSNGIEEGGRLTLKDGTDTYFLDVLHIWNEEGEDKVELGLSKIVNENEWDCLNMDNAVVRIPEALTLNLNTHSDNLPIATPVENQAEQ